MSAIGNILTSARERRFPFHDDIIVISRNDDIYFSIRKLFVSEAVKAEEAYMKKYSLYGDIETFVKKGFDGGTDIIIETIKRLVIPALLEQKIVDIDAERFVKDYYIKFFKWDEVCENINDEYVKIVRGAAARDAYRTARRQNRDKWVGYGFGIGGAIEASLKAGAMNMASGALHGAFNAIAGGVDAASTASEKSALYNSSTTKLILSQGIRDAVANIHLALVVLLSKRRVIGNISFLSENGSIDNQEAFINNIPSLDEETIIEHFPDALMANPWNIDLYKNTVLEIGDCEHELSNIAKYFDEDIYNAVEERKESIITDQWKELEAVLDTSDAAFDEDELLQQKEDIIDYSTYYGSPKNTNEILKKIDKALEEYDVKQRTVEGVTFGTRQEAEKARNEVADINKLLDGLDYKNVEKDAIEALGRFDKYDKKDSGSAVKYIDDIKSCIVNFDKAARTVVCANKEVVYDNREEPAKLKGMKEIESLEASYQKYVKEDPDEAKNLAAKLADEKIPARIRDVYKSALAEFKKEKQEAIKKMDSGKIDKYFIFAVIIDAIILYFIFTSWHVMNWFGLKSVLLAAAVFVPILFLGIAQESAESVATYANMLVRILPSAAFITINFRNWSQSNWLGMKGCIIFACLWAIFGIYCIINTRKEYKKANRYLNDEFGK
ncbi:MAG: hypothetical protein IJT22_05945 [Synergistaceae bacterium]|nr:hypothetical protein [Synergistaceae bacterium]